MADIVPPIPREAIPELETLLGRSLEGWDACPPRYSTPAPEGIFDTKAVAKVIRVLRRLPHTQGRWHGAAFDPEPWQVVWVLAPAFGWKNAEGNRIIREVWFEVPRKNGKTALASRLAIVLLTADGEMGAEVYAAAGSRDQARQVFDQAKTVVTRAPALKGKVTPLTSLIRYPSTGGIFRVLSKAADVAHGLNVHGAVVDEIHVHKRRDLLDAIETGTGARAQPMLWCITTADDGDETSIYAEKHGRALRSSTGEINDPSFYGVIWCADLTDDPFDERTWAKCNPNYPISPSLEYLSTKAEKAKDTPTFLPVYRRLHTNVRATTAAEAWGGLEAWPGGAGMVVEDKLKGRKCWAGLVASTADDLSAIALVFHNPEGPGYWMRWRWYLPEESLDALDRRTDGAAKVWVKDGRINLTDGDVLHLGPHIEQLTEDAKTYDMLELAYDPNGTIGIVSPLMESRAVDCVPIYATSPGSALLDWERMLRSKEINHGGDPVAAWQVHHLRVKEAATSVIKIDRRGSLDNVSGIAAAEMALRRALIMGEPRRSAYEAGGLTVI